MDTHLDYYPTFNPKTTLRIRAQTRSGAGNKRINQLKKKTNIKVCAREESRETANWVTYKKDRIYEEDALFSKGNNKRLQTDPLLVLLSACRSPQLLSAQTAAETQIKDAQDGEKIEPEIHLEAGYFIFQVTSRVGN